MIAPRALGDEWGCDTSEKLTAGAARRLFVTPWQAHPLTFLWRYVSLAQPEPSDITAGERDDILAEGWTLLLVQHVEYPGWIASEAKGAARGAAAAAHAQSVEYPAGCHIALDLEGCSNLGAPVAMYVRAWAAAVTLKGYLACLYVGYSCGLSHDQLGLLGDAVDVFWADYGPRVDPTGVGFACKQFAQVTVGGTGVDPDHAYLDARGRGLVGAVEADPAMDTADAAAYAARAG